MRSVLIRSVVLSPAPSLPLPCTFSIFPCVAFLTELVNGSAVIWTHLLIMRIYLPITNFNQMFHLVQGLIDMEEKCGRAAPGAVLRISG